MHMKSSGIVMQTRLWMFIIVCNGVSFLNVSCFALSASASNSINPSHNPTIGQWTMM